MHHTLFVGVIPFHVEMFTRNVKTKERPFSIGRLFSARPTWRTEITNQTYSGAT